MKQRYFLNTSESATVSYLREDVVFPFLLLPASFDGWGEPIARSSVAKKEYDSSTVSISRETCL